MLVCRLQMHSLAAGRVNAYPHCFSLGMPDEILSLCQCLIGSCQWCVFGCPYVLCIGFVSGIGRRLKAAHRNNLRAAAYLPVVLALRRVRVSARVHVCTCDHLPTPKTSLTPATTLLRTCQHLT
uniref:Uncharacterized protein n=1 Tax=Eutreptiella gymnastica TaxID=73025 RepID=A0A7S4CQG9_9EUGL